MSIRQQLRRLQKTTAAAAKEFHQRHEADLQAYRAQTSDGIREALRELERQVGEISGDDQVCCQVASDLTEYVDWLQWSLWDMPYFAVALKPSKRRYRQAVTACGLVYLSIRIFDDVIDRHFWYKGQRPTLLSVRRERSASSQGAEGLTLLAGLLLCFEGLRLLSLADRADLNKLTLPVLNAVRRAVVGAMMENADITAWNPDHYARLVELKNVDYWESLYVALDAEKASPLHPFLRRLYALAQHLNDIQDFPRDSANGQPNLLSLYPRRGTPAVGESANPEVEELLSSSFLELGRMAAALPLPEKLIAQTKLGEKLDRAYSLGLFDSPVADDASTDSKRAEDSGLSWLSNAGEVIDAVGTSGLESADCAVCGSANRSFLFRKHGFAIHRCRECTHIYVSPRIRPRVQAAIAEHNDRHGGEDIYLEAQSLFANAICRTLRMIAPGPRLLDVGFGGGHLMEEARAFGFEVFGIDGSKARVETLWPEFGRRLQQVLVTDQALPWGNFDVVVISHVLEHMSDPWSSLVRIREVMNPGGLLYVTVPDAESVQFKIFGKRWDVFNPLAHLQYFNEKSLSKLLGRADFTHIEKIEQPPLWPAAETRWMRLFRDLGGTASGEMAALARVPKNGGSA